MTSILLFLAVSVRFAWDIRPAPENVTSYNVFLDDTWRGETAANNLTITNIDNTRRRCAQVSATNSVGEGPRSAPVCFGGSSSSSSSLGLPGAVTGVSAVVLP